MRRVPAPPAEVYAILADYTVGHPHILPSAYFRNIEVEEGGVGAGTRIRFEMTVLGTSRTIRAEIEEPKPGRVLVERDVEGKTVTTFTLNPAREGRESDVAITTVVTARDAAPVCSTPGAGTRVSRCSSGRLRNGMSQARTSVQGRSDASSAL